MTTKFVTEYIDKKINENENFIRYTFYELRVKNNLSEEDILNELLIYCKINEGLKAIENGKTVTNEEMKKLILAC